MGLRDGQRRVGDKADRAQQHDTGKQLAGAKRPRRQQDGQVIGISCPTSQQKLTYLSSTDRHGRFIRMCAVRHQACFRVSVPVAGFC
jgi:hypothetical protein